MSGLPHRLYWRRLECLSPRSRQLVAEYLGFLAARHYAPSTMQATLDALNSFYWRLPAPLQRRLSHDLTQLSPEDVDGWLHAAHHQGLAPSTINTILSALHRLFAFLQEHGHIPRSPVLWRRHHVLVPQHLPRPMAEEDLIRFFQVIDALRDRLLFLLMLRCGLRVGEVSTLTWSAINAEARAIRIDNSKGLIDRVVYYAPDVEHALRQWRHTHSLGATYVFPSPLTPSTPLSVRAIQHRMATYLREAQITKPYSPHALRHTFATHLLNAGAGLEVVKELMGHRSISMTLRYAQLYEVTKRDQYYHAMERLEQRQSMLKR